MPKQLARLPYRNGDTTLGADLAMLIREQGKAHLGPALAVEPLRPSEIRRNLSEQELTRAERSNSLIMRIHAAATTVGEGFAWGRRISFASGWRPRGRPLRRVEGNGTQLGTRKIDLANVHKEPMINAARGLHGLR